MIDSVALFSYSFVVCSSPGRKLLHLFRMPVPGLVLEAQEVNRNLFLPAGVLGPPGRDSGVSSKYPTV